ncbi:sensor histidine kinase [uncultured Mobiluncus sp.]|uniref:sensor histidine kinase n=1 Tax=uncultured Mobiluncus sp. TaxID=293425 RepID=UPI00260971F0|nr:histidine kinase [uncultured Mobiluncus sp.]
MLRELFKPRTSKIQALIFTLTAAGLLTLNLVRLTNSDFRNVPQIVLFDLFFALSLTCVGIFPEIGTASYLVFYLLSVGIDLLSPGSIFLVLGLIPICVFWIYKKHIFISGTIFVSVHALTVLFNSGHREGFIEFIVFEFFIIAILGFLARAFSKQLDELDNRVSSARSESKAKEDKIRRELAGELHDNTAKDLTQISLLAQQYAQSSATEADRMHWKQVETIARGASLRLRPLIHHLKPTGAVLPVKEMIAQNRQMLLQEGIELEIELDSDRLSGLPESQRKLFNLFVQEGSLNVLKYAPRRSVVTLDVEVLTNGTILVIMKNRIDTKASKRGHLSSGYGLENLQRSISEVGGSLGFDRISGHWILRAEIPGQGARGHTAKNNDERTSQKGVLYG